MLLAYASWALLIPSAWAQDGNAPRNMMGGIGLIDMPSARMDTDGELSAGASFFKNTQHYYLNFQALPWLETSFRYSGLQNFDPAYTVYYDRSFAVKARLLQESELLPAVAVGINDLIGTGVYSSEYLVASKHFGAVDVSLGIGWGRLSSADPFRNPLTLISKSFETRSVYPNSDPNAGGAAFDVLFHGPSTGVFGGFVWETPLDGLSLIGEYSSDKYELEGQRGTFRAKNQVNIGATYRVTDSFEAGVAWLYGNSIGAHLTYRMNPRASFPERIGTPPVAPRLRSSDEQMAALRTLKGQGNARKSDPVNGVLVDALWRQEAALRDIELHGSQITVTLAGGGAADACQRIARLMNRYDVGVTSVSVSAGADRANCPTAAGQRPPAFGLLREASLVERLIPENPQPMVIDAKGPAREDKKAAAARIRAAIAAQQIVAAAVDVQDATVTIYYNNTRYFEEADALNRIVNVLLAEAPVSVENFRLVSMAQDIPVREFDLFRAPIERSLQQTGDFDVIAEAKASGAPMRNPALAQAQLPTYPQFSWSIFPQLRQQLFDPNNPFGVQILAAGSARLTVLPGLSFAAQAEASLFDTFLVNRPSDSVLPHVRTDFQNYFSKGKNGIGYLTGEYRFRLSPTVFGTVRAGYLESMFAGVGWELLWRPEGQRWALGADAYEVQQRDFDRLFGLQPYRTFTGHISVYYASPWYQLNFMIRAGQYLAGDRGITFQASRRFSSGVEVGAFFTKTNISSARFGEGSFDKGIIIRVPLGVTLPVNSQNELGMVIRPVQRDGGQVLLGDAQLYDQTQRSSLAEIENGRDSGL